ncbi:hypothetical protein K450DRAFT_238350 [Umbelopsis ramanniana AG]|uniref:thioredoxin-dependent peroxiredoxin n=1 Tax=Umbelopsis ramanniana AG TaxID=1314678 RepID=A0AAD5HDC5_UMBRA|nr:uncharacterized protein K450DRAFT_238350 [Umbelopsis ramanniana AG]KAI8580140.1 hypothetical protein K450DRAFT_238350 [Umbelopsis ramanniana AG]
MPPKRKAASAASEAISTIQAPTTRLTRSRSDASAKKPKLESTITLLKEGDELPEDLSPVTTNTGEEVRVQDLAKESGLLIFFYPRANTPGCTTQACGFRDRYEEVVADGWKVYGMSYDSPKAQTTWKTKYSLPYELLCDPKGDVLKRLGVTKNQSGNGGGVKRSHVVIEKGGRIKSLKIGVSPAQSIAQGIESMTGKSVSVTQKNEPSMNGGGQVSEPTNTVPATDSVPAVVDTTPITTIQAEVTDTPIDPAPAVLDSTPIQAEVAAETLADVAVDTTPSNTALEDTTEPIVPAIANPLSTLPTEPTAASLTAVTGDITELPAAESELPPVEPIIPGFLQDQIAQLPVASMVDPVTSAVDSTSFTSNPLDSAVDSTSFTSIPLESAEKPSISTDTAESANHNHEEKPSFGAYTSGLQQQL